MKNVTVKINISPNSISLLHVATIIIQKHYVDYQLGVDKGKLTTITNF